MSDLHRNFIAGEWTPGAGENRLPSNACDPIGRRARAGAAPLDRAVEAAHGVWTERARAGPERRHAVLRAIERERMERADERGRVPSREEGEPLAGGRGEVFRAGSREGAPGAVDDAPFGLASGIVARSLARTGRFRAPARTGRVMVDPPMAGAGDHVPIGGRGIPSLGPSAGPSRGPRGRGRATAGLRTAVESARVAAGAAA